MWDSWYKRKRENLCKKIIIKLKILRRPEKFKSTKHACIIITIVFELLRMPNSWSDGENS